MHRITLPKLFGGYIHNTQFAVKGSTGIHVPYIATLHGDISIIVLCGGMTNKNFFKKV